ncbi:MAG: RES family NAD+ phosphorylase [Salinarimonas sp.]
MAKFPEPPPVAELIAIGSDVVHLAPGTALARLFFRGGAHPGAWDTFRFWGPGPSRFDHHLPGPNGAVTLQDRGILYAAGAGEPGALAVCAAEVFQATRSIDLHDRAPWFATFRTARELALLDLRGLWPTRAGASSAIASGPKARARRWSGRIYEAYPKIDGLLYSSSMGGNADAVALYERARDALPKAPEFHRALADPALRAPLFAAAKAIGYAIV